VLMDLARENLVIKRHLHIATMEVCPDHSPVFLPALHRTCASRAQDRSFALHSVASAGCWLIWRWRGREQRTANARARPCFLGLCFQSERCES
jgi:hypothetical protein